MSRIAFTGNALGTGTVTIASPNTNADRTVTLPDTTGTLYISGGDIGTPSAGNASNLTNLNASNLSSGTVATARLASGTANNTTFLRGDQTWATVSGGVTSVATGNGLQGGTITSTGTLSIAAPGFNTVGSYVLGSIGYSAINVNTNYSAGGGANQVQTANMGSVGCGAYVVTNGYINNLSGTWRAMSSNNPSGAGYTMALFVRVA